MHGVTETSQYSSVPLGTTEYNTQADSKSKYLPKLFADKAHKMNSLFMEREWMQSENKCLVQRYLECCSKIWKQDVQCFSLMPSYKTSLFFSVLAKLDFAVLLYHPHCMRS